MTVSFAVVGYPNAGKSTLVNRLTGTRETVIDAEPGVTRDRKALACEWNGVEFELVDTGGIDAAAAGELAASVREQARIAIESADAVVFVVDARAGAGPGEAEIASLLRASARPVFLVANKIDRPGDEHITAELYGLGLGDPIPVSAAHGLGIGDLLDLLATHAGERMPGAAEPESGAEGGAQGELAAVAIVGRPNVGKSSLLNAITGEGRAIVSEQAGTTRDSVDSIIEVDGKPVRIVDTAGIRKRSKVAGTLGYYAQLRAERALERADIALLVCDAAEGITSDDLRIGERAMRAGCGTLVALNKWDLTRTDVADARSRLERRLRLRPDLITCSATVGRNVKALIPAAIRLAERRAYRIPTPELNRFVGEVIAANPPPAKHGKRLRAYYSVQVGRRPPRIAVHVNDRRLVHRDWAYHLENRIRGEYGLEGVPIVIDFVPRSGRRRREREGAAGA